MRATMRVTVPSSAAVARVGGQTTGYLPIVLARYDHLAGFDQQPVPLRGADAPRSMSA